MADYCEIRRTYYAMGNFGDRVPCMIYEPRFPGAKARIGIVLMHSDDDYIEYTPALELARRGYRVAAAKVSKSSNSLDIKIMEVGKVLDLLRAYPGVEKVLLLGHSGGATLMSAYQAAAENGPGIFRGGRIIDLNGAEDLLPADGIMLMDSNFGNGVMSLLSLDPSVTDEETGRRRDPSLNMFEPANGYDYHGCSYSDEFIARFLKAQAMRMNSLIDYCQSRVSIIDRGAGRFDEDEVIVIPGATQFGPHNKLFPQMPRIFSHTREAWDLIHSDGSVTQEVVPCRRTFRAGIDAASSISNALVTTVRTFLKSSAVRVNPDEYGYDESELYGVDFASSYCVTVGNMENVSVPTLLMGMTGSYEYICAEHIWRHAEKASDKTLAFVEGASHNFVPAAEAEAYPGEFGDTVKNCFDFADRWIESRFV